MVSLYITRERKNNKTYRYLIIEDKKQGVKLRFPIKTALQKLLWCGGWDLNPRRTTPSEPQSDPFGHARAPPRLSCFIFFIEFLWEI
jgi:hypothetical protein